MFYDFNLKRLSIILCWFWYSGIFWHFFWLGYFNWVLVFHITASWPHNDSCHDPTWDLLTWPWRFCLDVKILKGILDQRYELYEDILIDLGLRGYFWDNPFQLFPYFPDLIDHQLLPPRYDFQVAPLAVEEDDSACRVQESAYFWLYVVLDLVLFFAINEQAHYAFHDGQLGLVGVEVENVPVFDEVRDAAQALKVHALMFPEWFVVGPFLHDSLDVGVVLGLPLVQKLLDFPLRPLEDLRPLRSEEFFRYSNNWLKGYLFRWVFGTDQIGHVSSGSTFLLLNEEAKNSVSIFLTKLVLLFVFMGKSCC